MHRPIGVTLLAVGAALAGLYELYRMLIFMGVVSFTFVGKAVSFQDAQWGQAFWALLIALIWFWVAEGFWNVRGYAWTFGTFIALFTLIWGFMAILIGSSMEAETIPWVLSILILLYLYYPGVRQAFIDSEMSRLTPEQKAAMQNLAAANAAAAQAMAAPAAAPPPPPPAAAPPAPPTPPADTAG